MKNKVSCQRKYLLTLCFYCDQGYQQLPSGEPTHQKDYSLKGPDHGIFTEGSDPSNSQLIKEFLKLAVPSIITNMLGFMLITTNSIYAGILEDPLVLAAVGIGNVCCVIIVLTMFVGINSAQETLTSQASGNGNTRLCGYYLNRGFAINVVFYICLVFSFSFITEKTLFTLIGIDEELSAVFYTYIRYILPGMFFYGQFELMQRWSAAMRNTLIQMVA